MEARPAARWSAVARARKPGLAMAIFSLVLLAGSARAQSVVETEQSPSAVEQATIHYDRGIQFYENDAYEAALLEFQTAYELAPHFRVLYNIAQVCFELKDYACALRNFEKYLLDGNAQIAGERRREVEKEIATLRTLVARIKVDSNVPGATISVDDVVVGTTPLHEPVLVTAGRRKISAAKDGLLPITRIIDAPSGNVIKISFELRSFTPERAAKASRPQRSAQRRESEQEKSRFTTWSWVGLGAAGVLGTAGVVTGALALDKDSQYKESLHTNNVAAEGDRDAAQRLALTSDLLIGASIAALTTTLVITLTSESRPKRPVALTVTPHSLTVKGGF